MRVLGIDEAGRGCVLGPLVVASFAVDVSAEAALWEAGVDDSKALSHARRVEVRGRITALGAATWRAIEPPAIDRGNLNRLEEEAIAELVREARPDRVIVDALGHPRTLPATVERLRTMVGPEIDPEWTMEPKADARYAPVAAASIFAKTTRDAALADLAERWGELGSGYPSDPVTRAWLEGWSASGEPWPAFVRTRWATIDLIAQQSLF